MPVGLYKRIKQKMSIEILFEGILLILLLIYYLTSCYEDLLTTLHHSYTFLDCLFDGSILRFYSRSEASMYGTWSAVYYPTIYALFGVWNLIPWFLSRHGIIAEMNVFALLWAKMLSVVCTGISGYYMSKMIAQVNPKEKRFHLFLFASSMMVVFATFAMSQYDSISLAFTMYGSWRFLNEDKPSWKTLVCFSVAVSLKMFAFFSFALLVLIKEKRVIRAVLYVATSYVITLVFILIYRHDPAYHYIPEFNNGIIGRLFMQTIPSGIGSISLFAIFAIPAFALAYASRPEGLKQTIHTFAWVNALFFLALFSFMHLPHPQWLILLTPYLIILLATSDKQYRTSLILECALEVGFVVSNAIVFNWAMLQDNAFSILILKHLQPVRNTLRATSLVQVVSKCKLTALIPIFNAIYPVAGALLLILNHPWKKDSEVLSVDEGIGGFKAGISIWRLGVIIAYFVLNVMIAYYI